MANTTLIKKHMIVPFLKDGENYVQIKKQQNSLVL